MCPPPDAKAKKSAEYVESKGVLAEKYDVLLHFAITHMRRVDGALPQHSSGCKALDLLAKEGEVVFISSMWCSALAGSKWTAKPSTSSCLARASSSRPLVLESSFLQRKTIPGGSQEGRSD